MINQDQLKQNADLLEMDIQQEEIVEFFHDYWKPITGIMLVLVLITAGLQVYRAQSSRVGGQQMAALLPLVNAPASEQSAKALEDFATTKATDSRRALALLYAASKYEAVGKIDDVKGVLLTLLKSSAPEAIKDYARVLFVNAGGDAKTLKDISKKSPWQTAADEIRALAQPDMQKMRDAYGVLAVDPRTPPAMHQRAAEFSGQNAE